MFISLDAYLQQAWNKLQANFLIKLQDNVPKRTDAVLQAEGGYATTDAQLHFLISNHILPNNDQGEPYYLISLFTSCQIMTHTQYYHAGPRTSRSRPVNTLKAVLSGLALAGSPPLFCLRTLRSLSPAATALTRPAKA